MWGCGADVVRGEVVRWEIVSWEHEKRDITWEMRDMRMEGKRAEIEGGRLMKLEKNEGKYTKQLCH